MDNFTDLNNNELIPQYTVAKQKYTGEEKILLDEIRENLVDLAISSGDSFQMNEEKILSDVRNFLFLRLDNRDVKYVNRLSGKILRDLVGYGKIDSLIQDDDLEEIMVIGIDKPVYVYHRQYGMMKTKPIPCRLPRPTRQLLCSWGISVFMTDIPI